MNKPLVELSDGKKKKALVALTKEVGGRKAEKALGKLADVQGDKDIAQFLKKNMSVSEILDIINAHDESLISMIPILVSTDMVPELIKGQMLKVSNRKSDLEAMLSLITMLFLYVDEPEKEERLSAIFEDDRAFASLCYPFVCFSWEEKKEERDGFRSDEEDNSLDDDDWLLGWREGIDQHLDEVYQVIWDIDPNVADELVEFIKDNVGLSDQLLLEVYEDKISNSEEERDFIPTNTTSAFM